VIKEYRNYLWKVDRDGKILNEPEHEFSHSIDAIRFVFDGMFDAKIQRKRPPSGGAITKWG
jgi:phage terminase large subunit